MLPLRTGIPAVFLAALMLLGTVACSINETDVVDRGYIHVNATDITTSETLMDGQVFIDGVPLASSLPAVVVAPEGEAEVTVQPGLLYSPITRTVMVNGADTTFAQFNFEPEDLAFVTINATGPGDLSDAIIVVDDTPRPDLNLGEQFLIATGNHTFSVYKADMKTAAPALLSETLTIGTTNTFTFELEPMEVGSSAGKLFPDFEFANDKGSTTSLASLRGRPTLITFWFFDCVPCRQEFPFIQAEFEDRAANGFRVLGINVGYTGDEQAEFDAIRDQLGLTFPLTFNDYGTSWLQNDLAFTSAPTNFFLSATGEIIVRSGSLTHDQLIQFIEDAIADGSGE